MYAEDQLLPISALQHLLYCERQCALIHLEQAWSENRFTAEGRNLHEHVHAGGSESRGDTRTAKLANGRTVLQRSLRDHSETDADGLTAQAVAKLGHTLGTLAIISDPVGSLLHAQALRSLNAMLIPLSGRGSAHDCVIVMGIMPLRFRHWRFLRASAPLREKSVGADRYSAAP